MIASELISILVGTVSAGAMWIGILLWKKQGIVEEQDKKIISMEADSFVSSA